MTLLFALLLISASVSRLTAFLLALRFCRLLVFCVADLLRSNHHWLLYVHWLLSLHVLRHVLHLLRLHRLLSSLRERELLGLSVHHLHRCEGILDW